MSRGFRQVAALVIATVGAFTSTAEAGPLDPARFASLGELSLSSGSYTIDTKAAGGPTLTGGGLSFTGVISGGVAVFDFDSVVIGRGASLQATQGFGTLPVALLSRTTEDIGGTINVSASAASAGSGGGYRGLGGNGTTGFDPTDTGGNPSGFGISGGGGGGFLGAGGRGGSVVFSDSGAQVAGGVGGAAYGDLASGLQGGSSGAPGGFGSITVSPGGGGGAVELGAVLGVSIAGEVDAIGGDGSTFGAGGGSGGGIFIHAGSVSLSGVLDVQGGSGLVTQFVTDSPYGAAAGARAAKSWSSTGRAGSPRWGTKSSCRRAWAGRDRAPRARPGRTGRRAGSPPPPSPSRRAWC